MIGRTTRKTGYETAASCRAACRGLGHEVEQHSYRIKLVENDQLELDIVKFNLNLLTGETYNLKSTTGKISFFVNFKK